MQPAFITWTPAMLKRFKAAYKAAVKRADSTFTFDGNEYYVPYAKHLIEYLDAKFHASN